jgi:hypothetical protein
VKVPNEFVIEICNVVGSGEGVREAMEAELTTLSCNLGRSVVLGRS